MGSKKKKTTVGYKYSWDIHAGLGRGPVDELVAITADEKIVLATTAQQITVNTTVYINKPSLFGGTDVSGEGGVQGWLEVYFGEADQVPTDRLKSLLTGLVPGFRGIVSTLFSGLVGAYSASPKPWKYRVRRALKGWDNGVVWYPEKARIILRNDTAQIESDDITAGWDSSMPAIVLAILDNQGIKPTVPGSEDVPNIIDNLKNIYAMNPAHILVQAAISRDWGRGLSLQDDLDLDAYQKMADTLYEEGFGLCFRYNRQSNLDDFIQQILDHIGGVQYADLNTGKLTAKLIRNDYNVDDLPLFTYNNGILSVQDDDSSAADNAPNEIIVTFHDPVTNTDSTVRAQNLGAVQAAGLISKTADYPAIPTHKLAGQVAQRDLEAGASGLARLKLIMDRRGSELTPAGVFRISLADRNIENMVVRVGNMKEQDDGSLLVTVVQDVFGLAASTYSSGQPQSSWTPPSLIPRPVTQQRLMEIPYTVLASELSTADLNVLSDETCVVGIMATAPTSTAINYGIQSRAGIADYADRGTGDWTPVSLLLADVGRQGDVFSVSFDSVMFDVGDALLIDDEIVRIDAIDAANGTLTVGRACADTVPQKHNGGAIIWFYDGWLESDNVDYLPGETISIRLLTTTANGPLDAALATVQTLTLNQRQARPYPPGNVRINGVATLYIIASVAFTLTWAHRDRVVQGNNLVSHDEGNVGPEASTEYVIRLYKGSTLVREERIAGTEWIYPNQPDPDDTTGSTMIWEDIDRITLYSERDGLESLWGYEFTVVSGG
ncbi:hypothetical protein BIY29_10250 [Brenneria alni]|uniref:Tip attachment protein J domain-containing protein n=1 Tax=Brenneria alni TaxID=71656 RepID=A0A421DNS7_9GAMM|nr:phage tail protein [Brenneria alni]RLM23672.1 hypothetical protein BIY29_10250 [Brenneria alni]